MIYKKCKLDSGNIFKRVFISILGIGLILWALGDVALGIFGERGMAVITNIRRQGGERGEGIPERYTYVISYKFELQNGKEIDGFIYKIGDAIYFKASKNSKTHVRYFKQIPAINTLESETKPSIDKFLLIILGGFIIYIANKQIKFKKEKV